MATRLFMTDSFVRWTTDAGRYWDSKVPNFCLQVTPKRSKSWKLIRRINKSSCPVTITLGRLEDISLKAARDKARRYNEMISNGIDPRLVEKEAAEAANRTFTAIRDIFLDQYVSTNVRPSTAASYISCLNHPALKKWNSRPIDTIRRRDVTTTLHDIKKTTPIQANRIRAYLSKMFAWCLEQELVAENPIKGISMPTVEKARERILSDGEIKEIWDACSKPELLIFGSLIKALLLTGQRIGETSKMQWSELHDLDGDNPEWHLTPERTKNGRYHIVPLPSQAVEIISALPQGDGPYVFSFNGGKKPFNGFSKSKARLDAELSIPPWVNHDLRRTAMTNFQKLGVRLEVAEKILNRVSGSFAGITMVYAQHSYADEKRQALEAWANRVDAIISDADA